MTKRTESYPPDEKNPPNEADYSQAKCLNCLEEREGFEPSLGLNLNQISSIVRVSRKTREALWNIGFRLRAYCAGGAKRVGLVKKLPTGLGVSLIFSVLFAHLSCTMDGEDSREDAGNML